MEATFFTTSLLFSKVLTQKNGTLYTRYLYIADSNLLA
jgi:hypothetical protein